MPPGQYVRFKGTLAERMAFRSKRAGNGCLEWQGALDEKGYGVVRIRGRNYRASRVAWHLTEGPIPGHLTVCHTCDNPRCIEPTHLWLGTNKDNNDDKIAKGRHKVLRGEQHAHASLTDAEAVAIRKDPAPYADIAKRYGITTSSVSRIKCGHTWSHIPFEEPAVRRSKWGLRPVGDELAGRRASTWVGVSRPDQASEAA